ncbi:MAG: universal stress protein [Phycisphaerae bacterium]|nr:universal stress protein [Phycisphaerae bacterium]
MLKSILVGYDASESAERAVRFAIELAKQLHATIRVAAFPRRSGPPSALEMTGLLESAMERLERGLVSLRDSAGTEGVLLDVKILTGRPAEAVTREATQQNADLIVLGREGRSCIERWLSRSVAERVSSHAPCDVTIVR